MNRSAYRKRYATTIPLIAGNPLEPFRPQHTDEIRQNVMVLKMEWIGQSAAKLRTGEGSTTIPNAGVGAKRLRNGEP